MSLCATNLAWGDGDENHTAGQSIELIPNQWASFCPNVNIQIPIRSESFPISVCVANFYQLNDAYLCAHELNNEQSIVVASGKGLLIRLTEGNESRWVDFVEAGNNETPISTDDISILAGTVEPILAGSLTNEGMTSVFALRKNTNTFALVNDNVTIPAFKAYFVIDHIQAPSIRIVDESEITTVLENCEEEAAVTKIVRGGQLFIVRDGVTYDLMGRTIR